jgi:hypothetical protein
MPVIQPIPVTTDSFTVPLPPIPKTFWLFPFRWERILLIGVLPYADRRRMFEHRCESWFKLFHKQAKELGPPDEYSLSAPLWWDNDPWPGHEAGLRSACEPVAEGPGVDLYSVLPTLQPYRTH